MKTDLAEGTAVNVNMDVMITGTFNEWVSIRWVNTLYGDNLINDAPDIIKGTDAVTMKDGAWHHIDFDATVRNFAKVGIYSSFDTSAIGNAVYLVSNQKTSDAMNYKNVVITAK